MKQERVILSFVMVLIGLLVAGAAFYFYQSTKKVSPTKDIVTNNITPTPSANPTFYLIVNEPKDESIADKKTITISGKTDPDAIVVILTSSDQQILQPSSIGNFTTTQTIDAGVNYIRIHAIAKNGEIQTIERIVSYTTEDF